MTFVGCILRGFSQRCRPSRSSDDLPLRGSPDFAYGSPDQRTNGRNCIWSFWIF